jgi:PAS domain S-box-containing protein
MVVLSGLLATSALMTRTEDQRHDEAQARLAEVRRHAHDWVEVALRRPVRLALALAYAEDGERPLDTAAFARIGRGLLAGYPEVMAIGNAITGRPTSLLTRDGEAGSSLTPPTPIGAEGDLGVIFRPASLTIGPPFVSTSVYAAYAPIAGPGGAAVGWSSVVFRASTLLSDLDVPPGVQVTLHDGSGVVDRLGPASVDDERMARVTLAGTEARWTVGVGAGPAFLGGFSDRRGLVLLVGLAGTALLATLATSLVKGNRRWQAAARDAMQSLADSQERLLATIRAAPDLITVVGADGMIQFASARSRDLLGIEPTELVGRSAREVVLNWEAVRDLQDAGWSNRVLQMDDQVEGRARFVEVSVSPLRVGDPTSPVVAIIRDVSQRERARADQALLSSIVASTADPIIGISPEGHITSWNRGAEALYGWAADEVIGRHIEVVDDEYQEDPIRLGLERVIAGEVVSRMTRHRRRDGSAFDVTITLSPLPGPSGRIDGISLVAHDVTADVEYARALEAHAVELERSNRDLEEFASIASHDLSEPLRVVGGYVGLLTHRYAPGATLDERACGYLRAVESGVERMRLLIEGLLEVSRLRADHHEPQPVDLADVVDAAIANLHLAITEASAEIEIGPLPVVLGNQLQLTQLLQNLLANALRFRDHRRQLTVSVAAEPDTMSSRWRVSVRDTGIGIPAEQQDQIFSMFRRLNSEQDYPGLGIGLALCRRVVDLHGGELTVDSVLGSGSTFSFTLPTATPVSRLAQPQEALR